MEPIVGNGKYTYRVNEEWQQPPDWLDVKACAVSVELQDRVYCFNRNDAHPIVIFDRNGKFLSSWGAGLFKFPHAIRIVQENGEDRVWLCDEHHNQFYKFTTDGKLLQTIGEKGKRTDTGVPDTEWSSAAYKQVTHGGGPFNLPTDIAFAPDGSMFITDGYGNARVHKFSKDAKYQFSWGEPGTAPGQFNLPHGVWIEAAAGCWSPTAKTTECRYSTRPANCSRCGRPSWSGWRSSMSMTTTSFMSPNTMPA